MSSTAETRTQYQAAIERGGVVRREDRGIIEVGGADRATWLNNLVTNVVKTLTPGEGNYAFACNVKGRVLFDLGMLVLDDRLWLDVDRRWIDRAMEHFDRHLITEDVKPADLSPRTGRVAVMGPRAADAVKRLGLGNLTPMAQWQHVGGKLGSVSVRMIRNDFAGLPTAEFVAPETTTDDVLKLLEPITADLGMAPLDADTLEVLRIEAGIPASCTDIDEDVVPPETGRIEQGISYHKGCYLGQEVIERMRAHGVLARRLCGMTIEGRTPVPGGSPVLQNGRDVGRTTSCCWSPAADSFLALGYVKSAVAKPGEAVAVVDGGGERPARIVQLPVRGGDAA